MAVANQAAPPAPSARALRKFGLTVGGTFLVLGTISWWRGHTIPPRVLWTLGTLLFVPGLVWPTVLAPVERGWMRFAGVLAYVNTRIILGVVFYLVLVPIGVLRRLLKGDPLGRHVDPNTTSHWVKREPAAVDPESYRRQF
jgi:hypothetical protein